MTVSDMDGAASFWKSALSYVSDPRNPSFLRSERDGLVRLHLDETDQMHLDLWAADRDEQMAEVERLIGWVPSESSGSTQMMPTLSCSPTRTEISSV